jgi:hypothetical protein
MPTCSFQLDQVATNMEQLMGNKNATAWADAFGNVWH